MIPRYRAWDKEFKEMVQVNALVLDEQVIKVTYKNKNVVKDDVKEYVLMQSTGLKDKNGKEIFEGDVVRQVRTQPTTENEVIIGVVTMLEGAWLIVNDNEQLASDLWSETDENEVLGNIYENKGILEKKE